MSAVDSQPPAELQYIRVNGVMWVRVPPDLRDLVSGPKGKVTIVCGSFFVGWRSKARLRRWFPWVSMFITRRLA